MSVLNLGLTFYIIQLDEDSYNLYNATTDKDILFAAEKSCVKDFLEMNEPSHHFLMKDNKEEPSLTFDPLFETEYNYKDFDKAMRFEYSMYDPFYPGLSNDMQMSFSFMEDIDKTKERKQDTDNVLPFLPEEEK